MDKDAQPPVHAFEAVVLQRLKQGFDKATRKPELKLNRLLKFGRDGGASIETNFPAPAGRTLKGVVEITAKSTASS